jgi:AcrR family transcriptional regulator
VTDTRARLLETAERLFAERGVDGVSLREINRESGARNAVAVQYHFADRAGVLEAIFLKHDPAVEASRHALLDQYEAGGAGDLRMLAAALVRPLAAKLGDPDGGRAFLQIHADVTSGPDGPRPTPSWNRWHELAGEVLEADAARLHRRYAATEYAAVELGRRAARGPHADDRLFTSYLIDVVTAILGAPVSDETRRLVEERDRKRRK